MIFRCTRPDHDQRRVGDVARQARHRPRLRAATARTDGRRHQPGRPLRARDARRGATRRAVPLRDAVVRHGRLARSHVLRASRCRSASSSPNRAASFGSPRPTRSPRPRCSQTTCRRRATARRWSPDCGSRAGWRRRARCAARRRRISARRRSRRRTTTCWSSRATPAARSSIRAARRRWGRRPTRWPSSTPQLRVHGCDALRVVDCGDHADARVGQHERAGGDDRGEDRRSDDRRRAIIGKHNGGDPQWAAVTPISRWSREATAASRSGMPTFTFGAGRAGGSRRTTPRSSA